MSITNVQPTPGRSWMWMSPSCARICLAGDRQARGEPCSLRVYLNNWRPHRDTRWRGCLCHVEQSVTTHGSVRNAGVARPCNQRRRDGRGAHGPDARNTNDDEDKIEVKGGKDVTAMDASSVEREAIAC
jgi:hypothetical protein